MNRAQIMIVEDEALLALDLKGQLEDSGYRVTATASSCTTALVQVEKSQPDLLLMDIRIKGDPDGIDTARMIRERYDIPVVFLTAYADEEVLERAKACEPCGYLLKPVATRELHSTIEMALYKAGMEKERKGLLDELQKALAEVKTLQGMLPICSSCKKIRDSEGFWSQVEEYIENHTDVTFTHSLCEGCMDELYKNEDWYRKGRRAKQEDER